MRRGARVDSSKSYRALRVLCLLAMVLVLAGPGIAQIELGQQNEILRQALLALNSGRLQQARALLEELVDQAPDQAQAWLALAQTYRKLGITERAFWAAEQARKLAPRDPTILHGLTIFYTEASQFAKAAEAEQRYAQLTSDATALLRAAQLLLQANQPSQAIPLLRTYLNGRPEDANAHFLLASALLATHNPKEALQHLASAATLDPYTEFFHFEYAHQLLLQGQFQKAEDALENALRYFAKSPQIWLAYGVALYATRKFDQAAEAFLYTAQLAPELEQPYVFLARMLPQVPRYRQQIAATLKNFYENHPNSALATLIYAKALTLDLPPTGFPPKAALAEKLLLSLVAANKTTWEVYFELGRLAERKRDWHTAKSHFERAIQLNSNLPEPHYHLGRVLQRLGHTEQARTHLALHQKLSRQHQDRPAQQALQVGDFVIEYPQNTRSPGGNHAP